MLIHCKTSCINIFVELIQLVAWFLVSGRKSENPEKTYTETPHRQELKLRIEPRSCHATAPSLGIHHFITEPQQCFTPFYFVVVKEVRFTSLFWRAARTEGRLAICWARRWFFIEAVSCCGTVSLMSVGGTCWFCIIMVKLQESKTERKTWEKH